MLLSVSYRKVFVTHVPRAKDEACFRMSHVRSFKVFVFEG
jgi:hypothetical protein